MVFYKDKFILIIHNHTSIVLFNILYPASLLALVARENIPNKLLEKINCSFI